MKENRYTFESSYITLRKKENRVYSDDKVAQLPYLSQKDAHFSEWQLRAKTLERFLAYLKNKHKNSALLEIGSGNGWFSNACAKEVKKVIGIEVNTVELDQAKSVFQRKNLDFHFWDIFTPPPFDEKFDCIVFNAVIQYFPDVTLVFERLKPFLNPKGEIHLLDSPFYAKNEIPEAKKRSVDYFSRMGVPDMSAYYFHHSKAELEAWDILYAPKQNRLLRFFTAKDSPFAWYRLKC